MPSLPEEGRYESESVSILSAGAPGSKRMKVTLVLLLAAGVLVGCDAGGAKRVSGTPEVAVVTETTVAVPFESLRTAPSEPTAPPEIPTVAATIPLPTATAVQVASTATRAPATIAAPVRNCSPAYPDVCIPPPPPDLDCPDIRRMGFRSIRVLPPDPHRLDSDRDGIGCE